MRPLPDRFAPPGISDPTLLRPPPEEIGRVAGEAARAWGSAGPGSDAEALLVQGYRFELAGAHHELDGIEEGLGYGTPPDAHVPDRLDALGRRLAASVVASPLSLAGWIALAVLGGYLLARLRER